MKFPLAFALVALGAHTAMAWSCNDDGATTALTLNSLKHVDKQAVCNDGTSAAYYYAPPPSYATSAAKKVWLIYLAGGGQCWDSWSCSARWTGSAYPHHNCAKSSPDKPCFMSSKDYPAICKKTGIFSTDTSKNVATIAAAHKVYVPYCSSDAYMGDGIMDAPMGATQMGKFQFRGLKIVTAVLNDLVNTHGLDSASQVIFGGGSAGGRGAMAWLDHAKEILPTESVVGFLDSAYYVDAAPYTGSAFSGFAKITQQAMTNFNEKVLSNDNFECGLKYPDSQKWKCLFGEYLAPFVKTPYFLVASQYDSWQLSHLIHDYDGIEKSPKYNPYEIKFAEGFGQRTRDSLIGLTKQSTSFFGANHDVTVFSPACYGHHESEKALFWERKDSTGTSMAQAFNWFLRTTSSQFIDKCTTFNCLCIPAALGGSDDVTTDYPTTLPDASTTVNPCVYALNETACNADSCSGYIWHRSHCVKGYRSSGGGVAILVALLVIVILVGIGAVVFLVIAKLRRKGYSGEPDNFLVIGEPV